MTDVELVDRARRGDATAFGELIDRHRAAVYRTALAALRSPADADDAAQDAFLAAYRRLSSFRGESSFKTWLLTIAWHEAINRRRSIRRWWRLAGAGDPMPEEVTSGNVDGREPSPEQVLLGDRLRDAIVAEIRALPAKLRDTLLLAQTGEHRYEDIAAMLSVPIGTIKWRVSEARRMIRARLSARGYSNVG